MTYFTLALIDLIVLVVVYALWLRRWLKQQVWAQPFFNWIEPIELALYRKSETMLFGRLLSLGGAIVTLYDAAAQFLPSMDLTPITTRIFDAVGLAKDLRGLATTALFAVIGMIITWLRQHTTMPLEQLAAPEDGSRSVKAP